MIEVIVPKKHRSWSEMIKEISLKSKEEDSSWAFENAQFFHNALEHPSKEVPSYLFMMQHVNRSALYPSGRKKKLQAKSKVHNPIMYEQFEVGYN